MWDAMGLVRVYTKKTGSKPDFDEPVVLAEHRGGITVKHFCSQIHNTLAKTLKYAQVWGTSTKHMGQRVGLKHSLQDEDVVQVVKGDKADPEDLKGRFSVTKKNDPDRIADRVKKAKLKT
jgi:ribosome-interacting GTPase 1